MDHNWGSLPGTRRGRQARCAMERTRSSSLGRPVVWGAAMLFFGVYLWLDFNKLHALRMGSNTGSYLQAALNFVRHGTTFDFGDWKPEMAQHDQWMMLVLTPFAALWPRPETVITIQVAALALAAPVLYEVARRFGVNDWPAAAVALAYLASPSTQGFTYGEFVPLNFVPVLGFSLAITARARSLPLTLLFTELLSGTKEDVALMLVWFGVALAVLYERRIGLPMAVLAAVNFGAYELGEHLARVAPIHPQYALSDPEWPKQLAFFAEVLAPFAFAPLALGWRVLLAAPLAAELMFAKHWGVPLFQAGEYYSIPLITIIAIASAYVVAQRPAFARAIPVTAVVMAIFFNVTVVHIHRHPFATDPQYAIARKWALSDRPVQFPCEDQGAWVVASGNTNAQLRGCNAGPHSRHSRPAWQDVSLASTAAWTKGP